MAPPLLGGLLWLCAVLKVPGAFGTSIVAAASLEPAVEPTPGRNLARRARQASHEHCHGLHLTDPKVCSGRGTCSGPYCICDDGWMGLRCQHREPAGRDRYGCRSVADGTMRHDCCRPKGTEGACKPGLFFSDGEPGCFDYTTNGDCPDCHTTVGGLPSAIPGESIASGVGATGGAATAEWAVLLLLGESGAADVAPEKAFG